MSNGPKRETIREAGLQYVRHDPAAGGHILMDRDSGDLSLWVANKNHASYGLVYKNTHLEFVTSV